MLRLCANLGFLFAEMPFLDCFAAAARAGFTGVEYAAPYDYPARERRARLDDLGLGQVRINSPAGDATKGERGFASLPGRHEPGTGEIAGSFCCRISTRSAIAAGSVANTAPWTTPSPVSPGASVTTLAPR
jgi:hydroxypyruvate isomerase